MKQLFKTLVICGLFAWISGMTTSCTPDVTMGPPKFEIAGELTVSAGDGLTTPAISATLPVVSENIPKIYYIVEEITAENEDEEPILTEIRWNGTAISGNTDNITLTSGDNGLRLGKKYRFCFVVAVSNMSYLNEDIDPIFRYKFETPTEYYNATPEQPLDMMVLGSTYEGAQIDFMFPEYIKERGHKVKWGVTNTAFHKYSKWAYGGIDIDFMHTNENVYPGYLISGDTLINVCHNSAYRWSEKYPGEIMYTYFEGYNEDGTAIMKECHKNDPMVEAGTAEATTYHFLMAPGEPMLFMFTECGYANCTLGDNETGANAGHKIATCDKNHATIDFSWGPGWYWYPYNYMQYIIDTESDPGPLSVTPRFPILGGGTEVDENAYWMTEDKDGKPYWHKTVQVTAKQPEKFDGTVKITTKNLSPSSGTLRFTPSKNVYAYCVGVFPIQGEEGSTYSSITRLFLDNNYDLWQWFSTSEIGMQFGFQYLYNDSADGKVVVSEIDLAENYYLYAGMRYQVVVTAVPSAIDSEGNAYPDLTKQNFMRQAFRIPDYSKDAPELIVTAYDSYDPHTVKFNIKNPNYKSNKVERLAYAANYTREFESYMGSTSSYADIVEANLGYAEIIGANLDKVNSKKGYDLEIDYLRDNQEFTLAVMGWNIENRPSDPDAEGSQAVATARTLPAPAAPEADMTLLNSLKGDWTASATVRTWNWNATEDNGQPFYTEKEHSWKVTIGDLTSKANLTEEDYTLLESLKVSREDADKQWTEFKEIEKTFNETNKLQNRVLCQGWAVDDSENLVLTTPWDLFVHDKYGAAQTSYLFNDFGPKWFLQTNENGDIFIPVNYEQVPPLTRWYQAANHYLVSGNFEHGYAYYIGSDKLSCEEVGIPVKVESVDGAITITLQSTTMKYTATNEETGEKTEVECTGWPNVMYDYLTGPAFHDTYVVSEVVLTKGWTEPAPEKPEVSTSALRKLNSTKGKSIINSADYTAPIGKLSITPFTSKMECGKVEKQTYKILSTEEIKNNVRKFNTEGYWLSPKSRK